MKNLILTTAILVTVVITGLFINSCREDFREIETGTSNIPVLTLKVDSVSYTFANATVSLSQLPVFADSEYGICWDTTQQVTIEKNRVTIAEIKEPVFKDIANSLLPNTNYYLRGYFKTGDAVVYSNQIAMTTLDARPVVITQTLLEVKAGSVKTSVTVTAPTGFSIIKRGVCWSATELPNLTDNFTTIGSGNGNFISEINSLEVDIKYYLRAYATNSEGTTFGEQLIVITLDGLPHLTTTAITGITATTASSGGNITDDGGDDITARGVCYSTNSTPTISDDKTIDGTGTGAWVSELIELSVNTTYYLRAYATNSTGTVYGNEQTFTTQDGLPHLITTAVTGITATTATSGGNITDDGGFAITARGVCYSTSINPTTADTKTIDGTGTDSWVSELAELTENTTYYVRAYATNSIGTEYGNEQTFTTHDGLPQLTTTAITGITATTATSGGNITDDGGFAITARGVCYSTSNNPTIDDTKTTDGTGVGSWVSELAELTLNTTYYVRAYATNTVGTEYGDEQTFTTHDGLPQLTTTTITGITVTTATSGGNITDDGGFAIIARGVCYSTSINPTTADTKTIDGTGTGNYVSNLAELTISTNYYVRAYATNSIGTVYGNEQMFTTQDGLPKLTTEAITNITETTAITGGNITDDGGFAITARGVCYSTSINPTIDDAKTDDGVGVGFWISNLAVLTVNTTYYVRAYATNSIGTVYGDEKSFTTSTDITGETGTLTDYDGNTYNWIGIGKQAWMAENLKVTHYPNGYAIRHVASDTAWFNLGNDNMGIAYCFYNNDASLGYGALYTYAAAVNGTPYNGTNSVQGVCPDGWHLPSDAEWTELEDYLIANDYNWDGTTDINKIAKSLASTRGWRSFEVVGTVGYNQSTNNSTGFTALPGGFRRSYDGNGSFDYEGNNGNWWSSTENNSSFAWYRLLQYNLPSVGRYSYDKSYGLSVRCLRD